MAYQTIQSTCEKLLQARSDSEYTYTSIFRMPQAVSRHGTHYELTTISAARNLALRARGLSKTSCFVGVSGFGVSMRKLAL